MGFDKLLAEVSGKSVLERSVEAFQSASLVEGIIVVTSASNDALVRGWMDSGRFSKLLGTVAGGAERADSVAAGVAALPAEFSGVVAVHDAARPLILPETIDDHLAGRSDDPRIHAILVLARAIVERRGMVADEALADARAAGLSEADVVETVANVVANIFTNYLNNVAETDIDFPARRARAA